MLRVACRIAKGLLRHLQLGFLRAGGVVDRFLDEGKADVAVMVGERGWELDADRAGSALWGKGLIRLRCQSCCRRVLGSGYRVTNDLLNGMRANALMSASGFGVGVAACRWCNCSWFSVF